VLKWIAESGIGLVVTDEIAELIRKSEAVDKNISKIQEFLPLFPDEIKWEKSVIREQTEKLIAIEGISTIRQPVQVLPPHLVKQGDPGGQATPSDEKKKIATISPKDENIDQFDPISSLKQLQKYIQEIQNAEKKSQEKIARLEKNNNNFLNGISDLGKKQEDLKDELKARQRELAQKNAEISELKSNLTKSQQDSSILRQEKDNLLSQLEKDKTHYHEKLNRFSRTIEASNNYKQKAIINRIRESLRSEYRNLERIQDMDMTVEAGQVVRSLLKKIFSKLNKEGIDFAEDN